MKIGFIGLPKSGKTTLFNALTGSAAAVSATRAGRAEPNVAAIKVGDERIERLSAIYKPKRIVYPVIDIVDFAGADPASGAGVGPVGPAALSSDVVSLVRQVDAVALVLRGFPSDLLGAAAPLADLRRIEEELLIADLIVAEKRLEKIELGFKKGLRSPSLVAEEQVLRRVAAHLDGGHSLRELDLGDRELSLLRGFQFLTLKQALVILNSHESLFGKNGPLLEKLGAEYPAVEFAGEFEMELSRLDDASRGDFMADMGLPESAHDRLTALAYEALGYISFFTVGEDEVRAWNVRRDATALEAAAAIHSDLARGFIAAECFACEDLLAAGSERAVKENGRFRLAGKDYAVRDGDILSIRFNV